MGRLSTGSARPVFFSRLTLPLLSHPSPITLSFRFTSPTQSCLSLSTLGRREGRPRPYSGTLKVPVSISRPAPPGKVNVPEEELDAMLQEGKGPINFTVFLTLFGEKLNGEPGAALDPPGQAASLNPTWTLPGPGLNPTQTPSIPYLALPTQRL